MPWLAVVGALLFGVGVVAARPVSVDEERVLSLLREQLGGDLEVGAIAWRWVPAPHLELSDLVLRNAVALLERPLEVRAKRLEVHMGADPGRRDLKLEHVAADLGPLHLYRGSARVSSADRGLHLEGRALGREGGWIDATGDYDPRGPSRLQLYLAELVVPLPVGPAPRPGEVRRVSLDGALSLQGDGSASERVHVDVSLTGMRKQERESWLEATVRGELRRVAGRFLPGSRLDLRAHVREVDGERDLRAVHGRVRGSVALDGDLRAPRVDVNLDLGELRLRLGELLDKPAGRPTRLRAVGRLGQGDPGPLQIDLDVDGHRLRAATDDGEHWTLTSSWLPLEALRSYVPAVAHLPEALRARARLRGRVEPTGEFHGRVELRDLRLPAGRHEVRLARGDLHLGPDGVRLDAPGLRLGPERLDLSVEYRVAETNDPLHVRVTGHAESLDLATVAEVLDPLIGTPLENPTLDDVLRFVVLELRSRPRLLDTLRITPSALHVRRLRGMGLDVDGAIIRLGLYQRRLHLACEGAATDGSPGGRSVVVDLEGWAPSVESDG